MSKKSLVIISIVIVVIGLAIAGVYIARQRSTTSTVQTGVSNNPQDVVPGAYPNEIKNTATTTGFTIKSGTLENNTDPLTGKAVSDHLELTLVNVTHKPLTDFEVYYTMTDTKTQQQEAYYKKLTGYTLAANATSVIYFDNKTGDGHFTANKTSLYYKSTNVIEFGVQVSTPGYVIQKIQLSKAAGGAETKD